MRTLWVVVAGIFALAFSLSAYAQSTRRVTADGYCILPDNITRREARRLAMEDAEAKAVAEAAGVLVQSESLLSKTETSSGNSGESRFAETFALLTRATSSGKIVKKTVLADTVETLVVAGGKGIQRVRVRLEAEVALESGTPDPSLRIEMSLNQSVFMVNQPGRSSDELIVTVQGTLDGFLTLFGIADDSVRVLLPNEYLRENKLGAGERLEFPPLSLRAAGLHLRPALPAGETRSTEAVLAVLTKVHVPFQGWATVAGGRGEVATVRGAVTDLSAWLCQIPVGQRAEAHLVFEIRGK